MYDEDHSKVFVPTDEALCLLGLLIFVMLLCGDGAPFNSNVILSPPGLTLPYQRVSK